MSTETATPCTPANCGCKARTSTDALAGALYATGRTPKLDQTARESASAIEWALREYGWKIVRA